MIYHIALQSDWQKCTSLNDYFPSNFREHGFIHACAANQLAGVLARYYTDLEGLLLLAVDEKKLKSDVLYEPSTGGESFPHVYGPISKSAIVEVYQGEQFSHAVHSITKAV